MDFIGTKDFLMSGDLGENFLFTVATNVSHSQPWIYLLLASDA
jgi:hypothetical protein